MNDYERVARIIEYLGSNYRQQPGLETLAAEAGLSPHHFHRLFRRWAGTTPKNFLQHLTAVEAGRLLRGGEKVLETSLEVGLSGPGRLHDLCVNLEAASPGEIRSGGAGWRIRAGFSETPFGDALIAVGPRGVCKLSFASKTTPRAEEWRDLAELWPRATIVRDDAEAQATARVIFEGAGNGEGERPLTLFVRGTDFQVKVWRALIAIPASEVRTYGEIARAVDSPRAARAAGAAVGSNPVGFVIPCHRVIHSTGKAGNYRWGKDRKKAVLAWERCADEAGNG